MVTFERKIYFWLILFFIGQNVSLESSSLSPGGVPVENSDGQWDISEADENTKRFFGMWVLVADFGGVS